MFFAVAILSTGRAIRKLSNAREGDKTRHNVDVDLEPARQRMTGATAMSLFCPN
jgi:hypothetical protein